MFAFLVYKLGARLAQSLSLPTARKSAYVVGRLMCFLQRRNRRHLMRNLQVAFGDEMTPRELRQLRRRIFSNFSVFVADFLRMPLVSGTNLNEFFTEGSLEGLRRLGSMASIETPAITTSAHLGNWEMGAAATGLLAGPISVLVDVHPSPLVTAFFDGRRADKGIDVVPVSAFHRCFRSLKNGNLVAIVGDRPVTGQGIRVPYFGRDALMPDGYAVLARRFGAAVVPIFTVMTPDGRYEFIMNDPIEPRKTDDVEADVRDLVERCVALFEEYVRRYRDQWYVFRPIWSGATAAVEDRQRRRKTRPAAGRGTKRVSRESAASALPTGGSTKQDGTDR